MDNIRILRQCRHTFCEGCINKLLTNDPKCPLCRGVFLEDDIEEGVSLKKKYESSAQEHGAIGAPVVEYSV